jgi:sorbitol-specific phosphotransferase system component IIC
MHTHILAGLLTGLSASLIVLLVTLLVLVAIWDTVWKLIAMWKSGRNNQLAWFICLAIFNTAGILPIIYILFFQKKAGTP